jgi:endogenous inhibitor of DNA gyrase (YacG/DUF329 family)
VTAVANCAICGKAVTEKLAPFCSSRCATLDLGRWLGEGYRLPLEEEEDQLPSPTNTENDKEIG